MSGSFSGVILAGGQSRRMGTDKASLPLFGRTFAEHQAEKLRALGIRDILFSGGGDAPAGTRAVPDELPGRGPLGGLHAALKRAEHPACLVLPVDAVLVPESVLRALLEAHRGGVTVLSHSGRPEPLLAVYDSDLWGLAEELLRQGGDTSARAFLERAGYRELPYDGDETLLMNCNTPEDYRRARERLG